MKKQFLLLALSSCATLVQAGSASSLPTPEIAAQAAVLHKANKGAKRKRTNFKELPLIEKVDGKYGFFDGVAVHESLQALKLIKTIQYGKKDAQTQKRVGSYALGDKTSITLQDLVIQEQELIKNNVPKDDKRWIELNKTKVEIIADFNTKIKQLRGEKEENAVAKNIKHELIKFYLADQKRDGSLMANADKPNEKELLFAASATEFFVFLNDLSHFIEDMVESCPEAHKQYKEMVQKAHSK